MFRTRLSFSRPLGNATPARPQSLALPEDVGQGPFDVMPLPEVTECAPEEAWALWNAAIQGKSAAEADTVLMGLMPA